MKILHINNFYNPGGSALACYELAKGLATLNPDIKQKFVGISPGIMQQAFAEIGEPLIIPEASPGFNLNCYELLTLLSKYQPDIIHIWIPGHENPPYFARLPKDCKKVLTVLCGQTLGCNHKLFDQILFISKYNQQLSIHVDNYTTIRCGINHPDTTPEPSFNEKERPCVGRVSAFCPSKNIDHTLYVMIKLRQQGFDNRFVIAGEIQDFNYFKTIRKQAEENFIELHYNIDFAHKQKLLDEIDILHYPTSNEAFCLSILEGMRMGKAIVTYNNSAISELNHNDNLVMVPDHATTELLDATSYLLLNPQECARLGQRSFEVWKQHYTNDRYAREVSQVYDKVLT
jgi:glycosyltransferase involved in cell wall biosynthesis